ncbi:hypothetical protein RJT34_16751 [Clitoria ternatea]|uniref:GATA transcription factor n=1 Tax=Clitoria ternatea TaxID=43366 RepID=A0AAN9JAT5_CLITE
MDAPKIFQNNFCQQFPSDNKSNNSDHFIVEDLLDFPNDDDAIIIDATSDSVPGNSTESSTITTIDSCNSSSLSGPDLYPVSNIGCRNTSDDHFSDELCVPYDDLAELEWLSNFVEESFSSEDLQKLELISGMKARNDDISEAREFNSEPIRNNPIFDSEVLVPAKARSKRTRGPPLNWTSRLLLLPQNTSYSEPEVVVPTPTPPSVMIPIVKKNSSKGTPRKKDSNDGSGGDGRKCLHCATDKTPQWRTGPMGPKTLCNACGVRYKSGRLVPEYRPAASPTFVLTKHSNSHRKVMELRRQKEMVRTQQHHQQYLQHHHQNIIFDVSNNDDYLIHQHMGPDYRQLI